MAKTFKELKGRATNYRYSPNRKDEVIWRNVAHGHLATCGGNKKQTHKGWVDFDLNGNRYRLFASTYRTQTGLNITMATMEKK